MKKTLSFLVFLLAVATANAQYGTFISPGEAMSISKIVQVDIMDGNALVYLTASTVKGNSYSYLDDNTYVQVEGSKKKYKMLHPLNMGLKSEGNYTYLKDPGDECNYMLQFEEFPLDKRFTIFENGNELLKDVQVDTEARQELVNCFDFIEESSPNIMFGRFFVNGKQYAYWSRDGLTITLNYTLSSDYGKNVNVHFSIENNTGHKVTVDVDKFKFLFSKKADGEFPYEESPVPMNKYNDKVASELSWSRPYTPQRRLSSDLGMIRNHTDNEWAKLGISILQAAVDESDRDNLEAYYEAAERERQAEMNAYLRSNTLNDGESLIGFLPVPRRNYAQARILLPVDGFEFFDKVNLK